jgi:hypothetical protein
VREMGRERGRQGIMRKGGKGREIETFDGIYGDAIFLFISSELSNTLI